MNLKRLRCEKLWNNLYAAFVTSSQRTLGKDHQMIEMGLVEAQMAAERMAHRRKDHQTDHVDREGPWCGSL
jgi:hypothetical protein